MQPHVDALRTTAQRREAPSPLPQVVSPRGAKSVNARAANDAALREARAGANASDLDAYARHATASNGFGDSAEPTQMMVARSRRTAPHISDTYVPTQPDAVRLHRAAYRLRSRLAGRAIAAACLAIARGVRRAWIAYRQSRIARDTRLSLDGLDDRMLHDLGLNRSETSSIGEEVAGRAERTRMQTMLASLSLHR